MSSLISEAWALAGPCLAASKQRPDNQARGALFSKPAVTRRTHLLCIAGPVSDRSTVGESTRPRRPASAWKSRYNVATRDLGLPQRKKSGRILNSSSKNSPKDVIEIQRPDTCTVQEARLPSA